nr:hypothetical protein [Tanacetum cinerariifolium]
RHAGDIRSQTIVETQTARETMTAVPIRRNKSRVVTQIKWMDGVKFGGQYEKADDARNRLEEKDHKAQGSNQEQADLGAEISQVGSKYKKLEFENIDVPNRQLT